jgi:hypothetical protein
MPLHIHKDGTLALYTGHIQPSWNNMKGLGDTPLHSMAARKTSFSMGYLLINERE